MKVLVVGGGVAGIAAALAASASGADTTLVEGSSRLGLNRSALPMLLSGRFAPEELTVRDASLLSSSDVEVRLREVVTRIDTDAHLVQTGAGRLRFDALVLATGSRNLLDDVRGVSKQGVFVMRTLDDYATLSRAMGELSSVGVIGPAPLSLVVADALRSIPKVRVFLGAQGLPFSRHVRAAIARAAFSHDVELIPSGVEAIVGTRRVEAVLSRGIVHPLDAVVVLPRSVPALPEVACLKGDHAGVLVDSSMRSSLRSVFAAGDCAELKLGYTSFPSRLHSSSLIMGEVAGVNAAGGGTVRTRLARSMAFEVFGLEVCSAGLDVGEGRMVGLDVAESEAVLPEGPLCASLVYDVTTCRVHGAQVAGPGALSLSAGVALAVSSEARLEDLAYHDSPYLPRFNMDKSPIALTAGKALAKPRARTFEAQGTHLRRG